MSQGRETNLEGGVTRRFENEGRSIGQNDPWPSRPIPHQRIGRRIAIREGWGSCSAVPSYIIRKRVRANSFRAPGLGLVG